MVLPCAPRFGIAAALSLDTPPPAVADDDELATATVDLDAIAANTRWLAKRAAPAELMAVVKADAFGHGMLPVARATLEAGATWLGVARLREGLALRATGIRAPILAWQLEPACLREAVEAGIDVSASSTDDLERIAAAGARRRPEVHLKLDTGLHRAGIAPEAWAATVALAANLERDGRIHVRGLWSHLSHGDVAGHEQNAGQRASLVAAIEIARATGLRPEATHLANTGGVQQMGSAGCSMVRVGAGLYGIDLLARPGDGSWLRPAMRLDTRVVGVRTVAAGEGVGYGHAWTAERRTRLALIPMGYADGLPRVAGDGARMLVTGVRVPVAGRISMDQTILDVTDAGPVRTGDRGVVFGEGGDQARGEQAAPTAADWASWAGTIPHEILVGIGPRVVRRYVGRAA
ncbi:MAG: alanine racemase [Chloroflexota bacterium]